MTQMQTEGLRAGLQGVASQLSCICLSQILFVMLTSVEVSWTLCAWMMYSDVTSRSCMPQYDLRDCTKPQQEFKTAPFESP